jgi:hypothetical protein
MSKQFRTATQTRRGARGGYPEHDDFEGMYHMLCLCLRPDRYPVC